jgi:hypothetical protein
MSIRTPKWHLLTALAALALMLASLAGGSAAAQSSDDIGIMFRSWACPNATPGNEWDECDAVIGGTYRVEADGTETADSPVTTVQDTGIGSGVLIRVPNGTTTITVTQLSGAPDGYVPAPGFDPFTANIDELPQVGFGGESTGPGITFFNVPAGDDGDDSSDDTDSGDGSSDTTALPQTGAGVTGASASDQAVPAALLLAAVTLFGAGIATRRSRVS